MSTREEQLKNLEELILREAKNKNILLHIFGGFRSMPIKEFISQPADGILYDLDRLEEQIQITDRRSVQDFAIAKTIRALKARIEELEAK